MSYFPCDISFMSDEELKENGIRNPKEKMTNRKKLSRMSNQEIAKILCKTYNLGCSSCPACELCEPNGIPANGLAKWLELEAEEENETK